MCRREGWKDWVTAEMRDKDRERGRRKKWEARGVFIGLEG